MNRRKGYNDYPYEWNIIATRLKEKHNWTCERCGKIHSPSTGYTLTVHHLDRDKANCEDWNLAVLCQRCHLQIQNKVDLHQPYMFEHSDWMKPHLEGMIKAIEEGKYTYPVT